MLSYKFYLFLCFLIIFNLNIYSDNIKTLELWVMPNSSSPKEDIENILKDFEIENNIKVNLTLLDWWSALPKIIDTALKKDENIPDVVQLGTTWVSTVSYTKGLLKLNEYLTENEKKSFSEISWKYNGESESEDIYSLPWITDIRFLYYRKDILKKYNINPEKAFENWESFKETCKKINKTQINNKEVYAFGHGGRYDWNLVHFMAPFIWGAGGDFISEKGEIKINEKNVINGINYAISFYKEGLVPKEYLDKNIYDVDREFQKGEVAIIISGAWFAKQIEINRNKNLENHIFWENIGIENILYKS